MTALQNTMHAFFSQFALAYPESVVVDGTTKFPYITYDYKSGESMTTQLCTFQIWDRADHIIKINAIADQIEKAIPAIIGVSLRVLDGIINEWQDPLTEEWHEFEMAEFSNIVKQFYKDFTDAEFKYRQIGGDSTGFLKLMRATPFIQSLPVNMEEKELRRYTGNIEVKHYLI